MSLEVTKRRVRALRYVIVLCGGKRQRTASTRETADKYANRPRGGWCVLAKHRVVDLGAPENAPQEIGWE